MVETVFPFTVNELNLLTFKTKLPKFICSPLVHASEFDFKKKKIEPHLLEELLVFH